jgi:hypothetical protein
MVSEIMSVEIVRRRNEFANDKRTEVTKDDRLILDMFPSDRPRISSGAEAVGTTDSIQNDVTR